MPCPAARTLSVVLLQVGVMMILAKILITVRVTLIDIGWPVVIMLLNVEIGLALNVC